MPSDSVPGTAYNKSSKMLEEITKSRVESGDLVACFCLLLNLQAYNSAQYKVGIKYIVIFGDILFRFINKVCLRIQKAKSASSYTD